MRKEGQHKARKGLIKVSLTEEEGVIKDVVISGDFLLYPEDTLWVLEKRLVGSRLAREELLARTKECYDEMRIYSPGVLPEDFVEAIMKAV